MYLMLYDIKHVASYFSLYIFGYCNSKLGLTTSFFSLNLEKDTPQLIALVREVTVGGAL